jgi:hypothetical protein
MKSRGATLASSIPCFNFCFTSYSLCYMLRCIWIILFWILLHHHHLCHMRKFVHHFIKPLVNRLLCFNIQLFPLVLNHFQLFVIPFHLLLDSSYILCHLIQTSTICHPSSRKRYFDTTCYTLIPS